ncbi:hypothetical protein FGIG_10548 [Fasciola gigantica]|uniref:Uncharacterized protein n=1 Tax=Fasciola gigantica TaxID=46835 RepID=A0A504YUJ7_FASGI|nr:hypothetical protein FGIG_10548 [Fasciola gigantica]
MIYPLLGLINLLLLVRGQSDVVFSAHGDSGEIVIEWDLPEKSTGSYVVYVERPNDTTSTIGPVQLGNRIGRWTVFASQCGVYEVNLMRDTLLVNRSTVEFKGETIHPHWVHVSFALYDGRVLYVEIEKKVRSLVIKDPSTEISVSIDGSSYLAETTIVPLSVRADSGPWFKITRTGPIITRFAATSPSRTVLDAEFITSGHCPLLFTINGHERFQGKIRQHFGSPLLIKATEKTGAFIEPKESGLYKVTIHYEIYNDPGCGGRAMALIPVADRDQIKISKAVNRNIDFEGLELRRSVLAEFVVDSIKILMFPSIFKGNKISVRFAPSASGETLELKLLVNNNCFVPLYWISLTPEGRPPIGWSINSSTVALPNVVCAPCVVTVSAINSTLPVQSSDPFTLWFGQSKRQPKSFLFFEFSAVLGASAR